MKPCATAKPAPVATAPTREELATYAYLVHQVVARVLRKLPPNVLRRPKIGFDIPIHEWFRGVLQPMLLDTLSAEAVRASELFHWNAVEQLVRDHVERKAHLGYHLWGLMVLLLWMKQWNILPGSGKPAQPEAMPVLDQIGSL